MAGMTEAELQAVREANERLRFTAMCADRAAGRRCSFEELADAVDRCDALLAEVERLRAVLGLMVSTE